MQPNTRALHEAYCRQLAQLNNCSSVNTTFTVAPTVQQRLNDRVNESADFLQQINVVPVDQQMGDVLGLGSAGPAAGRTDTSLADREPRNLVALDEGGYICEQTDYDTFLKYDQLDMWAKFPDFQARVRSQTVQQIARDRLCVGFNGLTAAKTTNLGQNPLLQDVNIGWLQKIRSQSPQRVLAGVKLGDATGNDYRNLDALVYDARYSLIAQWHRNDTDIIAIVGDRLLHDKYLTMLNAASSDAATEKAALQTLILNQAISGRRAIQVPFFPVDTILLTKPSNLSIYWQNGSIRRHIEDQPRRNRVTDYLSMNESYVVEDLEACALIEGIVQPDGQGGWA